MTHESHPIPSHSLASSQQGPLTTIPTRPENTEDITACSHQLPTLPNTTQDYEVGLYGTPSSQLPTNASLAAEKWKLEGIVLSGVEVQELFKE